MQSKYINASLAVFFAAIFSLISFRGFSQKNYTLNVKVKNILIHNGIFYIALYNDKQSFLKSPCSKMKLSPKQIEKGIQFRDLPVGEYAVAIFQDLNDNKELDKLLSMPIEPYGLSNNPKTYPTYENMKFRLKGQSTITITLIN